jgi:hypothetical protein
VRQTGAATGKAFTIRIGADDAAYFLPDYDGPSIFAPTAFDKVIGTEITIDGTQAKVFDAVVGPGGHVADLMVEVPDDCGCLGL